MYVMIPVKKDTKKLVDERMIEMGAQTYDEAVREAFRPIGPGPLRELKGILKGSPPFVRDKRDRNFG